MEDIVHSYLKLTGTRKKTVALGLPRETARDPRRADVSLLTKVILSAMFVDALSYAPETQRLGQFDPEADTIVACLLLVSALVATGWRWTRWAPSGTKQTASTERTSG